MSSVAAIDVGSSSVRMLLGRIDSGGVLREAGSLRAMLPLGREVFATGRVSQATVEGLVEAFRGFRSDLDEAGAERVAAVATSALRDAANTSEILERIYKASGIRVELIDGLREAQLVFSAVSGCFDLSRRSWLLVDIGGGSIELTVARDGKAVACQTLALGPVRLRHALDAAGETDADLARRLQPVRGSVIALIRGADGERIDVCIGTGGTLRSLGELAPGLVGAATKRELTSPEVDKLVWELAKRSPAACANEFGLRSDRADVIGLAARLLRWVMDEAGSTSVAIPGAAMKQGLLFEVARELVPDVRRLPPGERS